MEQVAQEGQEQGQGECLSEAVALYGKGARRCRLTWSWPCQIMSGLRAPTPSELDVVCDLCRNLLLLAHLHPGHSHSNHCRVWCIVPHLSCRSDRYAYVTWACDSCEQRACGKLGHPRHDHAWGCWKKAAVCSCPMSKRLGLRTLIGRGSAFLGQIRPYRLILGFDASLGFPGEGPFGYWAAAGGLSYLSSESICKTSGGLFKALRHHQDLVPVVSRLLERAGLNLEPALCDHVEPSLQIRILCSTLDRIRSVSVWGSKPTEPIRVHAFGAAICILCILQRPRGLEDWANLVDSLYVALNRNRERSDSSDFVVTTANITAFSSGLTAFKEGQFSSSDIVLVQEHRLGSSERVLSARHQLEKIGWRSHIKQAAATEKSTSGGVGIAFAPWISVKCLDTPAGWHWCWLGEVDVGGVGLIVGCVYGSQDSEENLQRTASIVNILHNSGRQWILGGDFNVKADQMEARGRCLKWKAEVKATGSNDHTCFAGPPTRIDYFIASTVMASLIDSVITQDSGLATHRMVHATIPKFVANRKVDVIQMGRGSPGKPVLGPHKPICPIGVAGVDKEVVQLMERLDRKRGITAVQKDIDTLWDKVIGILEPWVRNTFGVHGICGNANKIVKKSLAEVFRKDANLGPTQKQGLAELRKVKLREVTWLLRRMMEFKSRIIEEPDGNAVHKFRAAMRVATGAVCNIANFSQGLNDQQLATWTLENIPSIQKWQEKLRAQVTKDRQTSWRDCLKKEVGEGTSLGFKIAKPKADINYAVFNATGTNAIQDQMDGEFQLWQKLWTREGPEWEHELATKADHIEPFSPEQIRQAARRFKKVTSTVEGLHPGMFAHADDGTLRLVSHCWQLFDRGAKWPAREKLVSVRLIAKPSGGLRPIALFRTMFRLLASCQRTLLRDWARSIPDIGLNCRPGRRVADTTYRLQIRESLRDIGVKGVKGQGPKHAAEVCADLTKAYDMVDRHRLLEYAIQLNYPLSVLYTSLTSYTWDRVLVAGMLCTKRISPVAGILAGSMAATFEMLCYTHQAIIKVQQVCPRVEITMHVDDFNATIRHWTPKAVAAELDKITAAAFQHFEADRLEVAKQKTFYITSDLETDQAVQHLESKYGGKVVEQTRRLGIGHALANRDRQLVVRARFQKAFAQIKRLRELRKAVAFAATRVLQQGVLTGLCYGIEHQILQDKVWDSLRKSVVSCTLGKLPAVHHTIGLLCLPVQHDPLCRAIAQIVSRWAGEVWHHGKDKPSADAFTMKELEAVAFATGADAGIRAQLRGPIQVLAWALDRLGWTACGTDAGKITRGNGEVIDLSFASPTMVKHLVLEDWANLQFQEALQHMTVQGDEWTIRKAACKLQGLARVRFCQILAGHLPTRQWFHEHVEAFDPMCQCGQLDDLQHRLQGCFLWSNELPGSDTHESPNAITGLCGRHIAGEQAFTQACLGPQWPKKTHQHQDMECKINGTIVGYEGFKWAANEPVYTDGSAKAVGTPASIGGAAAIQFSTASDGASQSRQVSVSVPVGLQASATMSEHLAMWIATSFDSESLDGCIDLVADCAAIAKANISNLEARRSYKCKFAGFWENHRRIRSLHWVKSHMSVKDGVAAGFAKEHIIGNERADLLAEQARARFTNSDADHIDWLNVALSNVKRICSAAERVAQGQFDGLSNLGGRPFKIHREQHVWIPFRGGSKTAVRCNRCELVAKRPSKASQKCFGQALEVAAIHFSHAPCSIIFEDGSRCVSCILCGAYKFSRFRHLANKCRRKLMLTGRRLAKGLHPTKSTRLVSVSWFSQATRRIQKDVWGASGFDQIRTRCRRKVKADRAFALSVAARRALRPFPLP